MRVPRGAPPTEWGDHLSDYVAQSVAMGLEAGATTAPTKEKSGTFVASGAGEPGWGDHLTY